VFEYLVPEHVGVAVGMPDHERCPKAGREGDLRLFAKVDLGAAHLGRVPRDKVVHRLFRRQLRDRRHDSRGITGQHDDILRMSGHLLGNGIVDILERIGTSRINGQGVVIQIELTRDRIVHNIFEYRPEFLGTSVYLWLGGRGEVDDLGVTAAFNIENALVAPSVLIVADQLAGGVGRQSSFSGSGETKEESGVAVTTDVCRTVHTQDILTRQKIVHHGEGGFLDFSTIA